MIDIYSNTSPMFTIGYQTNSLGLFSPSKPSGVSWLLHGNADLMAEAIFSPKRPLTRHTQPSNGPNQRPGRNQTRRTSSQAAPHPWSRPLTHSHPQPERRSHAHSTLHAPALTQQLPPQNALHRVSPTGAHARSRARPGTAHCEASRDRASRRAAIFTTWRLRFPENTAAPAQSLCRIGAALCVCAIFRLQRTSSPVPTRKLTWDNEGGRSLGGTRTREGGR